MVSDQGHSERATTSPRPGVLDGAQKDVDGPVSQIASPAQRGCIELRDLRKNFGSVAAVDGVSLRVEGGEFLALLGPSGSGKTTILNLIAGFEQPAAGAILVDGLDVSRVPPHRRGIGVVFQAYALFPHMTVADNVAFPLKMRHVSESERRRQVAEALDLVRLTGLGSRYPRQLSGGQQQRVALARAIVFKPTVLLMDEPLGALDKKLRQHMQIELRSLQRGLGTTVVYVTHDQEEALTMADRVAVLRNGLLQQVGVPEELYENPRNAFVADFVGETNFLRGTVRSAQDGTAVVALGSDVALTASIPHHAHAPAEGTAVRVAIRPERITLSDQGPASPTAIRGELTEILYVGATTLYVTATAFGTVMARVSATSGTDRAWRLGDAVTLSWGTGDARVYEDDPL